MKKAIIIIIWAIVLTLCLVNSAHGQIFNSKPTAVTDSCFSKTMNVLTNDKDENGDALAVTKFNGLTISNTGRSVEKKDTGTFVLTAGGNLTCLFSTNFYGTVHLTYYVNDGTMVNGVFKGKGSSAIRQNGKIVVIRSNPTGEIRQDFGYILRNNDSCKFSKRSLYWVEVVHFGDTVPGLIYKYRVMDYKLDSAGRATKIPIQVGWAYRLNYRPKGGREDSHYLISEEDFIYIEQNACKD